MLKHSFSDFSYAVNIDSAKKGHKEVLVCFIYNGIEVLKKVYIPEKAGTAYILEAKKIIDQEMRDGTLAIYSHRFINRNKRKRIQPKKVVAAAAKGEKVEPISTPADPSPKGNKKWVIATVVVAAIAVALAATTIVFATKKGDNPEPPTPPEPVVVNYDVAFHLPTGIIEPDETTKNFVTEGEKYNGKFNVVTPYYFKLEDTEVYMGSKKLTEGTNYTFTVDKINQGILEIKVPATDIIHITLGAINRGDVPVSEYDYEPKEEGSDDVIITELRLGDREKDEVTQVEFNKHFVGDDGETKNIVGFKQGILSGYPNLRDLKVPFIGLDETPKYSLEGRHLLGALFGRDTFPGAETLTYQDYYGKEDDPETGEVVGQHYLLPAAIPSSLSRVTITDATEIPMGAFSNCTYLQDVTIESAKENEVTSIDREAFHGCRALKNFKCEDVTTVKESAFDGCQTLASFDFSKITLIEKYAFRDCLNLNNIYLPESLGEGTIETEAFGNYVGLIKCYVDKKPDTWDNSWAGTSSAVVYGLEEEEASPVTCGNFSCLLVNNSETKEKSIYIVQYLGEVGTKEVEVPDELTIGGTNYPVSHIGAQAFMDYIYTEKIDMSECTNLLSIDSYGFYNCRALKEIKINSEAPLKTIGAGAFAGCTNLVINDDTSPTFPNVTTVSGSAFKNDSSLVEVKLPSATSVGISAFENCSALKKVTLSDSGVTLGEKTFNDCSALTEVTCKATGVIPDYCFNNTGLTSINVPKEVTEIGNYAYALCSKAKSITFEGATSAGTSKLTCIGSNAFLRCRAVNTSVTLPDSLTTIGSSAFQDCYRLPGIDCLSANLTAIPDSVCYGDSALDYFIYAGDSKITSIGAYAFAQDQNLDYVGVKTASGTSNNNLPGTLRSIGDRAFINCVSLGRTSSSQDRALAITYEKGEGTESFSMGEQVFYGWFRPDVDTSSRQQTVQIDGHWISGTGQQRTTAWNWRLTYNSTYQCYLYNQTDSSWGNLRVTIDE